MNVILPAQMGVLGTSIVDEQLPTWALPLLPASPIRRLAWITDAVLAVLQEPREAVILIDVSARQLLEPLTFDGAIIRDITARLTGGMLIIAFELAPDSTPVLTAINWPSRSVAWTKSATTSFYSQVDAGASYVCALFEHYGDSGVHRFALGSGEALPSLVLSGKTVLMGTNLHGPRTSGLDCIAGIPGIGVFFDGVEVPWGVLPGAPEEAISRVMSAGIYGDDVLSIIYTFTPAFSGDSVGTPHPAFCGLYRTPATRGPISADRISAYVPNVAENSGWDRMAVAGSLLFVPGGGQFGLRVFDLSSSTWVAGTAWTAPGVGGAAPGRPVAVSPSGTRAAFITGDTLSYRVLSVERPDDVWPAPAVNTFLAGGRVIHDGWIYEAVSDSPSHPPQVGVTSDPPQWLKIEQVNSARCFDATTGTLAVSPAAMWFELRPTMPDVAVVAVAIMGVSAASARFRIYAQTSPGILGVIDDTGPILLSETPDGFLTPSPIRDVARRMAWAAGAHVRIDVYPAADEGVSVGEIVVGMPTEIGETRYGADLGILDFSVRETDAWGVVTLRQRAFSKRGRFSVALRTAKKAAVIGFLASIRARPVVWVADWSSHDAIIMGYYDDVSMTWSTAQWSDLSLTVVGV